jgi:hypothetical protein
MNKTFVTTTLIVAGALGLAACSKPAEAPAPPAPAPAAAAPAEAPAAAPAAADAPANAPQGDGEVLKKP